ncbi:hypothetical protein CsSME_00023414 [Camellia sinensis var. sinensis]
MGCIVAMCRPECAIHFALSITGKGDVRSPECEGDPKEDDWDRPDEDGYTKEVTSPEAVLVLVATKAKQDSNDILVTSIGWANTATINIVYVLQMMGRDDIPVGLGDVLAIGQADPSFTLIGDCKYRQAIPRCSGGFLDSDTLWFCSLLAS